MTSDGRLQALEKYNVEKDIAAFIKKEFDKKYNPTWHAIVGRNFGKRRQQDTLVSSALRWQSKGAQHNSVGCVLYL